MRYSCLDVIEFQPVPVEVWSAQSRLTHPLTLSRRIRVKSCQPMSRLCCTRTVFPGSRNVPNVLDVPNVPNDVPNIPGHVGQDGLLAEGYVAKISMLWLNIGSGMLRLSSCMLRLSLTSSVQGGPPRQSVWGPRLLGLMRCKAEPERA